ncbi:hypothetical protein [Amycolatopsis lexingtonensis]|uniref:hypothetical protein n=1 Tax=Amycolatopsis lexingtonensis TaxID=218822 RepID=UPI003F6F8446
MTDDRHPISDAELDIVLGGAYGRLDQALDRAINNDEGPARVARAALEQERQHDLQEWHQIALSFPAPRSRRTESRDAAALMAVNVLIKAILLAIDRFPAGYDVYGTSDEIDSLARDLEELGRELVRRTVGRQDAKTSLRAANQCVENALLRIRDLLDGRMTERDSPLVAQQGDACTELLGHLNELEVAVEKLFDVAEGWSVIPINSR